MESVVSYLEEQAALTASFFKEQSALNTRFQKEQAALLQRAINNCKRAATFPLDKKLKKKKVKDPNRPKRPLSGYQLFMADHNSHYKAQYPNANTNEMMSILGKAWGVLDETKKAEYLERARGLKDNFLAQKKAYEETKKNESDDEDDDDSVEAAAVQAAAAAIAAAKEAEVKRQREIETANAEMAMDEEEKKKKHKKHKKDKH